VFEAERVITARRLHCSTRRVVSSRGRQTRISRPHPPGQELDALFATERPRWSIYSQRGYIIELVPRCARKRRVSPNHLLGAQA
jgi:hypothetical protein